MTPLHTNHNLIIKYCTLRIFDQLTREESAIEKDKSRKEKEKVKESIHNKSPISKKCNKPIVNLTSSSKNFNCI